MHQAITYKAMRFAIAHSYKFESEQEPLIIKDLELSPTTNNWFVRYSEKGETDGKDFKWKTKVIFDPLFDYDFWFVLAIARCMRISEIKYNVMRLCDIVFSKESINDFWDELLAQAENDAPP